MDRLQDQPRRPGGGRLTQTTGEARAQARLTIARALRGLLWLLVWFSWFTAGAHAQRAAEVQGAASVGVMLDALLRVLLGVLLAYAATRRPADMRMDALRVVAWAEKVRGWSG